MGGGGADSIHCSGDRLPFLTGAYYGHKREVEFDIQSDLNITKSL